MCCSEGMRKGDELHYSRAWDTLTKRHHASFVFYCCVLNHDLCASGSSCNGTGVVIPLPFVFPIQGVFNPYPASICNTGDNRKKWVEFKHMLRGEQVAWEGYNRPA